MKSWGMRREGEIVGVTWRMLGMTNIIAGNAIRWIAFTRNSEIGEFGEKRGERMEKKILKKNRWKDRKKKRKTKKKKEKEEEEEEE